MHAIIVKCEFFFWKKLELQCMFIWVYCNISIFQYRLTYFIVILKGLSPEQFSLLHFWTVKYIKRTSTKRNLVEPLLYYGIYFASPLAFVRYIEVLHVVGFRGLRNLSWQSIWEIDVYSAVLQVDWSSWSLSPSSLNLNYLWMGEKKLFNTCPFRNYSGKLENENCSNIYLQGFPLALSWTNKSLIIVDMT